MNGSGMSWAEEKLVLKHPEITQEWVGKIASIGVMWMYSAHSVAEKKYTSNLALGRIQFDVV